METNTTTITTPAAAPAATKRAPRKVTKPAAKPAAKPSPVAKAKLEAKADAGKIALKTICGQLKIEPKAARRALRKAKLAFHDRKDRWLFTPKQAATVRDLLKA